MFCRLSRSGGEGREGRSGDILMLQVVGEQQLTSFSFPCRLSVFCFPGHVLGAFLTDSDFELLLYLAAYGVLVDWNWVPLAPFILFIACFLL